MAVLRVIGLLAFGIALYYGSFQIPDGTSLLGHINTLVVHAAMDLFSIGGWFGLWEPILMTKKILIQPMTTEVPSGVEVQDMMFDGVPVRIYTPKGASPDGPGVMYYHGGGWVWGTLNAYNVLVGDIAVESGMVVVSVEYRLAPEFRFPFAFEDCTKAANYFINHAADFKVNPKRIAVAGDSAGGNLAAAVSLKLNNQLKAQVLIYSALQAFDFDMPSYQITGPKGVILTKTAMVHFWLYYAEGHIKNQYAVLANNHTTIAMKQSIAESYVNVGSMPRQYIPNNYVRGNMNFGNAELWKKLQGVLLNPYFAPLAAPDVSTVPQALILTAEYDVLRDDGILYAQKLEKAGVRVSHYHSSDGTHGMVQIPGRSNSQSVKKMLDFLVSYIKETL